MCHVSSICELVTTGGAVSEKQREHQELTQKALWDGEGSVIAGADHRVAAPVGPSQAGKGNMFSVENSVGLQVCNLETVLTADC